MKIFILLLFILLTWQPGVAQSPAKLLKRAEAALGGAKALRSVRSSERSGEITRRKDGARGRITFFAARPDSYAAAYDIEGFETAAGFNGKSAWTRNSRDGSRTMTGAAGLNFRSESVYRNSLWLDYKKDKTQLTSAGRLVTDGKTVAVVILKTVKGAEIKLFLDERTGLPIREEFSSRDKSATYDYADFRRVGRLLQPFRVTYASGGETFDISFEKILVNEPIASSQFDFPASNADPLPDIPSLLLEVQANEDRVDQLLETYSYTEKRTMREPAKDGSLIEKASETFQVSFYQGFQVNRLVETNGRPLTESEQADADRSAAKSIEQIDKIIAKRKAGDAAAGGERLSIAEILRASNLINARRERLRGRDVIVFDFEPNKSFDYKKAKSTLKFFGKTAGVIWIDAADKQVARIEAVLADSFNVGGGLVAKLKKGASFTLEQERVNDEIWLPSAADINLSVRVFLIKGLNLNQTNRYYDYRKFKTEVNDAKIGDTVKQ